VNALAGRLSVAKKHIQKAMYEDNIEWLMQYGRKNGNVAAIKEAQRNLEKINNDFKEDDNPQEQMPNTNINITSDVSIIKKDRKTMTDEEREQMRKKYGLTQKEYAIQLEEINGIWKQPDADEPEQDIFVENEHE
jgi:DNA-binding transcriptional regulator YiaG